MGPYLSLGVVLCLEFTPDDRVVLVRIDQVIPVIAHNAGGTRVYQDLDIVLSAGGDDGTGPVHVDFSEHVVGDGAEALGGRRGRVDDDIGRQGPEELRQAVGVGDVGFDVVDAGSAVALAPEVDDGDGALPVAQEQVHDVVAEEAAAADDEDFAE